MTGNQIRAMRLALGLTVQQLAVKVGVTGQGVRNWEACGAEDATPQRRTRKWDALVLFLSTASPKASTPAAPADPLAAVRVNDPIATPKLQQVKHDPAGLLWPWLETAGPEYRARIRREIEARR